MSACQPPAVGSESRRLPLRDNPVFHAELRRQWPAWARLLVRGVQRKPPSRPLAAAASLLAWALATAVPYLLLALPGAFPALKAIGPAHLPIFALLANAYVAIGLAGLRAFGVLLAAADVFPRDRRAGRLDDLLLTRLTAGEIVAGKVAAVLVPAALATSLTFLVWIAVPPVVSPLQLYFVQLGLPVRVLLLCLWADALALSAAAGFIGMLTSGNALSSLQARVGMAAWALSLTVGLAMPLLARSLVSIALPAIHPLGLRQHASLVAVWVVVAICQFCTAQTSLAKGSRRVDLVPFGSHRVSTSPRVLIWAPLLALVVIAPGYYWADPERLAERAQARLAQLVAAGRANQAAALVGSWKAKRGWAWSSAFDEAGEFLRGAGRHLEAAAAYEAAARCEASVFMMVANYLDAGSCLRDAGDRGGATRYYRLALSTTQENIARAGILAALYTDELQIPVAVAADGLKRLGDRTNAVTAYELAARGTDPQIAQRCREDIALVREGLDQAPSLPVSLHYASGVPPEVTRVPAGSDAARAGLRRHDRVLLADGRPVTDRVSLARVLSRHRPGETVAVVVERGGKRQTYRVRLDPP